MDGKAERRWLGTSPCDNERTIALRTNALRAYEGKSSELIRPGPRSRVGTNHSQRNRATIRVGWVSPSDAEGSSRSQPGTTHDVFSRTRRCQPEKSEGRSIGGMIHPALGPRTTATAPVKRRISTNVR